MPTSHRVGEFIEQVGCRDLGEGETFFPSSLLAAGRERDFQKAAGLGQPFGMEQAGSRI